MSKRLARARRRFRALPSKPEPASIGDLLALERLVKQTSTTEDPPRGVWRTVTTIGPNPLRLQRFRDAGWIQHNPKRPGMIRVTPKGRREIERAREALRAELPYATPIDGSPPACILPTPDGPKTAREILDGTRHQGATVAVFNHAQRHEGRVDAYAADVDRYTHVELKIAGTCFHVTARDGGIEISTLDQQMTMEPVSSNVLRVKGRQR